jgi:hypothetical protein
MSTRTNIARSVAEMVDFIKERTTYNVVQANRTGVFDTDEESLRKIVSLIDQSVSQAFVQAYTGVENALKDLE